jgi:plasmid stabilization system protein ParE
VKPHGFHREADAEYAAAAGYYASISPELGGRFYEDIEQLIAEACAHPRLYRRVRGEIRRHFTAAFPYGILFEDRPDHIRILAVMNLHRDPDYWLHRLEG